MSCMKIMFPHLLTAIGVSLIASAFYTSPQLAIGVILLIVGGVVWLDNKFESILLTQRALDEWRARKFEGDTSAATRQ